MVPEVGIEPTRDYSQGILSQLTSSIDHNSAHVSPRWTTVKLLIKRHLRNFQYVEIDVDDVDCCEQMSHECPKEQQSQAQELEDDYMNELTGYLMGYGAVTVRQGWSFVVPERCSKAKPG